MAMNNFERRNSRRYTAEFLSAMGLYTVIFFVVKRVLPGMEEGTLKIAVAVSPMIGVLLAAWAIGRGILRADEHQRKMLMEIIVWAAGATAVTTIGYGILERPLGLPLLSMNVVWPVMGLYWIVVSLVYWAQDKVRIFVR
jgi:hypothetical protein